MEPFWKTSLLNLPLLKNDIHIWRAELDLSNTGIEKLSKTLSSDEKERAERFHFDRDRNRFVVGRGILRDILARYLSVESSRLRFSYGKTGKPALADPFGREKILFNMSDSEGLALFAFTRNREIGVDIEKIRDIAEMEQIVAGFFSPREYRVFRELPENKKKEAFFNCWTRKEAFIKAMGAGLSYPLDKFGVSLVPGEPARLLEIEGNSQAVSRWCVQELKPAFGFAAALAVEKYNGRLHCWHWSDSPTQKIKP